MHLTSKYQGCKVSLVKKRKRMSLSASGTVYNLDGVIDTAADIAEVHAFISEGLALISQPAIVQVLSRLPSSVIE